jgi:DNA polymerase-3 subunit alpha
MSDVTINPLDSFKKRIDSIINSSDTSSPFAQRLQNINKENLAFELRVLDLETYKLIKHYFENKIRVDNHSNSALLYLLGLTNNNYDPDSKCTYTVSGSAPDIDTDFSSTGRDKLIRAIQEKYGYDNVAKICTYTPWNLKTSVVDFTKQIPVLDPLGNPLIDEREKVVYHSYKDGEAIADKIPDSFRGRHTTWKDLKEDSFFKDLIKKYKVFNYAGPMDGQPKNSSIHPCGVIISSEPLHNYIPLRRVISEESKSWFLITQWETPVLEKLGFIKFDTLIIDNLDLNQKTCELIGRNLQWLDEEIPTDDKKAFALIRNGYTAGIFQIEESHVASIINDTKPNSIEDIAAISALIRPGPKDAGLTSDWIKYKQTGLLQNRLHPLLDPILKQTGGVLIYQEQVIEACSVLAGIDKGTADEIRKAMGKKDKAIMDKYKDLFVKGCEDTHKIPEKEGLRLWATIEGFSDYG